MIFFHIKLVINAVLFTAWYSLGQLTSHPWASFGKGENKGSALLWYSCFDNSILMFLMCEGLQCHINILKQCLMRLLNVINQLTFVFPFAETRSIKWMWCRLTERISGPTKGLDETFYPKTVYGRKVDASFIFHLENIIKKINLVNQQKIKVHRGMIIYVFH